MSDLFTALAGVVALGASIVSGPVGPVEARPELALHRQLGGPVDVLYRDGEPAGILRPSRPTMRYQDMPPLFLAALKASEDRDFDRHLGVSPAGLARAALGLFKTTGAGVGGSTLTQQLAKNLVAGNERSLSRKLAEIVSAVETEAVASKEEIIESYANAVYFGRGSHGAANAAANWFGKTWSDLDTGEIAFLAGVVQAPSALDPRRNPERASARRDYVLSRMRQNRLIDAGQARQAASAPLQTVARNGSPSENAGSDGDFWAIAMAERIRRSLAPEASGGDSDAAGAAGVGDHAVLRLPLDSAAQKIASTALGRGLEGARRAMPDQPLGSVRDVGVDPDAPAEDLLDAARSVAGVVPAGWRRAVVRARLGMGDTAGKGVKAGLLTEGGENLSVAPPASASPGDVFLLDEKNRLRGRPSVQGAVVVIDLGTGEPLAVAGGVETWASGFDRTTAMRQPGSAIKPFLWLAALEDGFSPYSPVSQARVMMRSGDTVWTPSNYGGGRDTGTVALYKGLEESLNTVAARLIFEIGTEKFRDVLERAGAYPKGLPRLLLPSASLGAVETTPMRMARAVARLDPRRSTLSDEPRLVDIERMMRGVVLRGTAWRVFQEGPDGVAGKTGTSQDNRDSWFVGRTGDIALAVWTGRDDDRPMAYIAGRPVTGASLAAPIAADIVRELRKAGISREEIETPPFERRRGVDETGSQRSAGAGMRNDGVMRLPLADIPLQSGQPGPLNRPADARRGEDFNGGPERRREGSARRPADIPLSSSGSAPVNPLPGQMFDPGYSGGLY